MPRPVSLRVVQARFSRRRPVSGRVDLPPGGTKKSESSFGGAQTSDSKIRKAAMRWGEHRIAILHIARHARSLKKKGKVKGQR